MYQKIFPNTKNIYIVFAGIVILLAGYLLTQTINKPFIGHHDWNGVQYGNMARNHLRYGLSITRLGQIENAGVVSPQEFSINTHHPATLPLILATSIRLFGFSEKAIRLVPILFSLITIVSIMYVGWHYIHPLVGISAGVFASSTPMFRYFGNMPVHEPIIVALVLLVVIAYLKWRDDRLTGKWLWLSVVAASSIGWPGYYITPLLFLSDSFSRKKIDWQSFLPIFLTQIGLFILHLGHNWWLTGSAFGGGLLEILSMRLMTLTPTEAQESNSFLIFLIHEAKWVWVYFTRIQVVLTCVAVMLLVIGFFKLPQYISHSSKTRHILVLLLIYGGVHALLFRNAAYIHEYMLYYLIPGIALASAWTGYIILLRLFKNRVSMILIILLGFGLFSFSERNAFVKALQNSNMHLIGKQVGEEIASVSQPESQIFMLENPTFNMVYSKFVYFYSDRNIQGVHVDSLELLPTSSIVFVPKHYEPDGFIPERFDQKETLYYLK